jgi:hypothetical protein
MMCDVPSMAVFCKESIECCPGIVSRYFCKLLLTIPVAPMMMIIITTTTTTTTRICAVSVMTIWLLMQHTKKRRTELN